MERCVKCGRPTSEPLKTAYGETRCEYCWDDHLMTDKGKVEYLIGIVRGDYPLGEFDADFLGLVAVCWNTYRQKLTLSADEIRAVEDKARELGIL